MSVVDQRNRIARFNPALGAFVDLTDEVGIGLGWGVKANIAVKGLPHTAGIEAYADYVAPKDAEVVRRIRASGGTVLGTLNMHEGALGATTDNTAFGRTQNPWREGHTPGGSSGGSGAAVAARLCDIALGSDTMGSARIPAAYCGVQGHKPTTGSVPDDGVLALSPTLDHVGPLAATIDLLWQAMHVLADWGAVSELVPASLTGLKIAAWDGGGDVALESSVASGMAAATREMEALGAVLSRVGPPVYEYGRSRRAGLLISEVEGHAIHEAMLAAKPSGFTEGFKSLMAWGARQSPETLQEAYDHIAGIHAASHRVWDAVDIMIAPTAPQTAFAFTDAVPANQADFTAWANFAGLPATAVFTGLSDDGLPLSLQVIGPEGHDRQVLQVAAALEAMFGRPPVPPEYS